MGHKIIKTNKKQVSRVNNDSFVSFQDANGSMGFTKEGIQTKPVAIIENHVIVQIASGSDHLVCLTDKGEIITLGKFSKS